MQLWALRKTKDWKAAWHILGKFYGLGPRMLNGNKTPAVGPIENKDLKAPGLGAQNVKR